MLLAALAFADEHGFLSAAVSFPLLFFVACLGPIICSGHDSCEMHSPGLVWPVVFLASAYNAALVARADAEVRSFYDPPSAVCGHATERLAAFLAWMPLTIVAFAVAWGSAVLASVPGKPGLAEVILCTTAPFAVASHLVMALARTHVLNRSARHHRARFARFMTVPATPAAPASGPAIPAVPASDSGIKHRRA